MTAESVLHSGAWRTPAGVENVRARDRARRRALATMLRLPAGERGSWRSCHRAARLIRDRHPRVWRRVLADELAKETVTPLPLGRPPA